jgi:hypothetical protein
VSTKKLIFALLIVLSMGILIQAQSKGKIVLALRMESTVIDPVTGEWPDMTWFHALENAGYEVIKFYNASLSTADQSTLDTLLSANLIVIGRSVPTLTLGGNSANDKLAWNGIPVPILTGNMWALRSNRLNWFNTTTINTPVFTEGVPTNAIIEDPSDPVFAGLEISGPVPWINGTFDALGTPNWGNGTILAYLESDASVLFVRFEPDIPFYDGTDDLPAGPRTYIGNGRDASSQPPFNYYTFTPESEKVFFAEVARMVALGGGGTDVKNRGNETIPSTSVLYQNYPNPFNPTTNIEFSLPVRSNIKLSCINILGEIVKVIASGNFEAGNHKVTLDASNLSTGVYFYRLEAGDFVNIKKLILIK